MQDVLGWVLRHPDEALGFLALVSAAVGALNRWAVANKRDRLAQFTSAMSRVAGRINLAMQNVPVGTTAEQFRDQLIRTEAVAQMTEWATTASKIGASTDKTIGIIEGELGKLAPVVAGMVGR
jgi:hypothetical protein